MRILIAPDKFKGSLTAAEVAASIAAGLTHEHTVTVLPLADGGDGTVDATVAAGFVRHDVLSFDGSTLVVELANTCGLALLDGALDPLGTSTMPLGRAFLRGLALRPTRVVVAVGGSASTDGGMGLLTALGARFLDDFDAELEPSGRALTAIRRIDLGGLRDLSDVELVCATDVDNPLTGARGAAAVFGPQKGASPEQVTVLDAGLRNLVRGLAEAGVDEATDAATAPGSGAAGGTAFAVLALGGRVVSGADYVLDLLGFDALAAASDLVITGEGRLDEQTAAGKLVAVVARRAAPAPVVAVVGTSRLDETATAALGLSQVYALARYSAADTSRDAALSTALLARIGAEIDRAPLPPHGEKA